MSAKTVLGRAPGVSLHDRVNLAALRALRTLVQSLSAAVPTAGLGPTLFSVSYWSALGYSCVGASLTALASLLHNVAGILPQDQPDSIATESHEQGVAGDFPTHVADQAAA